MIRVAPETAIPATEYEYEHFRVPLIPLNDPGRVSATIYLRSRSLLDANEVTWEAIGFLDGENVFDVGGYENRRNLIGDVISHLAARAAKSRKKDMKAAATWLHDYLTAMEDVTDDAMAIDDGEIWNDDPAPAVDTNAAVEPLAGEGGESADPATPTPATDNYGGPTPEAIAAFRQRLDAAHDELADAAIEFSRVKTIHKAAKDRFDAAVEQMASIADRGPESAPLFDKANSLNTPQATSEASNITGTTNGSADSWRAASIDELGLPPKLTDKLRENGINTIGELEDKRAGFNGLREISGIGPAKVTVIEDAVMGWLDRNRDAAVMASVQVSNQQ